MIKKVKTEKLLTVNKARRIMNNSLKNFKLSSELIDFRLSENRVLAENIYSNKNIPEYDNSAVDGFGINYDSIKKKNNFLKIVGTSKPGKPFKKSVKTGEAIIIYTGAYILKKNNINTVCYEENCNVEGNFVKIKIKPKLGDNIRIKGEDIKKNKLAFKKGRKIRVVDLAQVSSLGQKKIRVYRKIKVGVFSSGDELSINKKKFSIFDSNKIVLLELIRKLGCEANDLGIIKDNFNDTYNLMNKSLPKFDVIITSGGISKSKIDEIGNFFSVYGKISFWRLALKPGRPFAFGKIKNTPFIGLPGNPVAAIVTFLMLVANYLKKISGNKNVCIMERILPSNFSMEKKTGRTEWLRGTVKKIKNNLFIEKFPTSGSGIISSISNTDGIIEIDDNISFINKGTLLKFIRYEDLLN